MKSHCLWLCLGLLACDSGTGSGQGPTFLPDASLRDAIVALRDVGPGDAEPSDARSPEPDAELPPLDGDISEQDQGLVDAERPRPDRGDPDAGAVDAAADARPPDVNCHDGPDPLPGLALVRQGRYLAAAAVVSSHVRARGLTIYLPASYDAEPNREWPVLYAHDGQNLFDAREAAFGVAWELDDAVDALVTAGVMQPIIVVGVHNTADRIEEYTPSRDAGRGAGGRADAYGRFLVEELKPALDHRLRTRCAAEDTGLLGSSLGGLVSFWLLGEYPNTFGRVGVVSPSFWWNGGEARGWAQAIAQRFPAGSRLWIDAGGAEGNDVNRDGRSSVVEDSRAVVEALGLAFPQQLAYLEIPGAAHNEAAWQERTPAILAWLWGADPGAPDDLTIEVHGQPLQGVAVPVSVHARWPWHRLTLPHGVPMWVGPVAGGELTAEAGAARYLARWRGREAAIVVDAPRAARVEWVVSVPRGTPGPVYVTGGPASIGGWDPEGLLLRSLGGDRWGATVALPAGLAFEFKFTRGSWETVEKGPGGEELPNRQVVAADGPLELQVARWADSP